MLPDIRNRLRLKFTVIDEICYQNRLDGRFEVLVTVTFPEELLSPKTAGAGGWQTDRVVEERSAADEFIQSL